MESGSDGSRFRRRRSARKIHKRDGLIISRRVGQSFVIVQDDQVIGTVTLTRVGDTRADLNLVGDKVVAYRSELWEQMQKTKQQAKETTDGPVENQGLARAV